MAEQEGALLGARVEEPDGLHGPSRRRPVALGALGAALLIVAACVGVARSGGTGSRGHPLLAPSLAEGSCLLTLDVSLANLAPAKLDTYVGAKVALVDGITRAFEGRLPAGQVRVQVEVLAYEEEDDAITTVQVTLVPRGDTSAGDFLATFLSAEAQYTLRVLIAAEANHAEGVPALADGEVLVSNMEEGPQSGDLQLTAADVEAGATVVPMGATTLEEGEVITVVENRANGLQAEATIVSKSGGDLQVAPPLPHPFARGSLVIFILQGHQADQVTDTIVLENLPASKLDDRMRAEVEQQVVESYAEALKVSPDQVDAHVKSAEGRRLADGSSSTELDVAVTPAEGQSPADLASAMDASRDELDSAVQNRVQQVPGISDIALGPITAAPSAEAASVDQASADEGSAGEAEFRQKEGSAVPVARVAFFVVGGIVCLGCLASCAAIASIMRAKKDAPAEGTGPAQDEVPLASSEAWLGPEQNQPARGPLQLSPPREELEELSDQPDESPPLPPPEEVVPLPVPMPEDPREELLRKVFAKYDHDRDSLLNEEELLAFAVAACEFAGSADEWGMEYSAILEELGKTAGGLGIDEFRQLVSDPQLGLSPRTLEDPEAVSALYCSDDDLVRALEVQRGNKELHKP